MEFTFPKSQQCLFCVSNYMMGISTSFEKIANIKHTTDTIPFQLDSQLKYFIKKYSDKWLHLNNDCRNINSLAIG